MDFYIDKRGYLFIDGFCHGSFEEMQSRIIKERKDLVDLFKVKAILNKDLTVRYIADWKSIVYFYLFDKFQENEKIPNID